MTLRDTGQLGHGGAFTFLDVTLDAAAERLTRGGADIRLRPKSFQVLKYLVERAGRLVTREELLEAVWADVAVTDESITKCIADIRTALNDHSQQAIRTVARRGYVFAAPVSTRVAFPRPVDQQADLASAILATGRLKPHPIVEPATPGRAPRALSHAVVIAGMLIAGAALASVVLLTARRAPASAPVLPEYTPLTNFTDAAFAPALSPDGRMLAFIRGDRGTNGGFGDIYIKLLPDGEPVRLTHDGKNKMAPAFTPGGDRIAFSYPAGMTNPKNWSTWMVSVFGSTPQLMLSNASALTWLPRATPSRVLFSEVDDGVHMSIVTAAENRSVSRVVYAPGTPDGMAHRSFPSPDGSHMLVSEMENAWMPCRLVPLHPSPQTGPRGAGRRVGPSPGQCTSAAWSPDGTWMYFSVNTGNGNHIWRQRFPDGVPEQVTNGATEEHDIAFDPDGRSFVAAVGTRESTLWLHDPQGERQVTSEGYAALPSLAPDRRRLYYLLRTKNSRQYVNGELWAADLDSGHRERLLSDFLIVHYNLSADGRRILFAAIDDRGRSSVWLTALDGRTAPVRVATLNATRVFFGRDRELLLWATEEDGRRILYRVNDDGTGLQPAIPYPLVYIYDVSPGGGAVAAWRGAAVEIIPLNGSAPITVSSVCAAAGGDNIGTTPPCVRWSRDRRILYFYDRVVGQVYSVPIPPGRDLPDLPPGGIASAAQAAALPGARVIRQRNAFMSDDPDTYPFFQVSNRLNIYRIRVQ